MKKVALIFGVTGQDGSYLSELLIKKNYIVHGVKRRSSSINTNRIDHIYQEHHVKKKNFFLHYGDITDSTVVSKLIKEISPNEIYNLAAQSHVAVSFEVPEYTANADALGALRILEAIKFNNLIKKTKFYQAGTSEMYGEVLATPQNESTQFNPISPYGVAKLYAHMITTVYRKAYGIYGANGILFNHESPRRGETFVTKKIISALCKIKDDKQKKLYLGNIYSKRDWGHARDYCVAMWKILQQSKPSDYVIATGKQYSIKQFINYVCENLKMKIIWKGRGINEKAYYNNKIIIECDKKYFRPIDVESLLGDAKKAKKQLNWKPQVDIKELIKEMIEFELLSINK
tara:strand:- start:1921 stop:2955 length:1035 start_codon:yes stop_codon:yes gene_type:complete